MPKLHCWTLELGACGFAPRIFTRCSESCAGSRKFEGKPLCSRNSGESAVDASEILLLISPGGFSANWSSLPMRSNGV